MREHYRCTVCGKYFVEKDGKKVATSADSLRIEAGHSCGKLIARKDATCTADGTQTRVCTYDGCGKKETIPDPASATGHDFGEWQVTKKATPFANGLMESACSRCDATQTVVLNAYGLGTTEITVIAVAASVTLLATALAVVLLILIRKKK